MKKIPLYAIEIFTGNKGKNSFYSNELTIHLQSHQFVNLPHKHADYIAILFTKGKGIHQIDFENYVIQPGSVFLLYPGQVHNWTVSKDARGYVFFHNKEFYDSIFLNKKIDDYPFFYLKKNHQAVYLTPKEQKKIETLFRELNEEYHSHQPFKDAKLQLLTDMIYLELSRLYFQEENNRQMTAPLSERTKQLIKLIDQHFKENKSANDYAVLMHMSVRHLSRIVRDTLNCSTSDLIIDRIVLEAKRLLIHHSPPVSWVAQELGYKDTSYFIRLFKKNTGISPRTFQIQSFKKL